MTSIDLMEYLTLAGLQTRYSDLVQFGEDAVASALEDANGIAFGYVAALYPGMAIAPVLLKAAVADIARRRLYQFDPPEGVQKAHDDALRLLRDIGRGDVTLVVPVPPGAPVDADSLIFSGSNVRLMDRQSLGYRGTDEDV